MMPVVVELFTLSALIIFLAIVAVVCLLAVAFGAYSLKMGIIFAVVFIAAGFVFYLVDTHNGHIPIWIGIVLFVICTAAAVVGLIATSAVRDSVENKLDQQVKDTTVMVMLRNQAETLCTQTDNQEMKKIVRKVADDLKYSSPVSTQGTSGYEDSIRYILMDMSAALQNNDLETLEKLSDRFQTELSARNQAAVLSTAEVK